MKKGVFFFANILTAQQPEKVIGSVKYLLMHQRDTLSSEYYTEYMGLVFSSLLQLILVLIKHIEIR